MQVFLMKNELGHFNSGVEAVAYLYNPKGLSPSAPVKKINITHDEVVITLLDSRVLIKKKH